MPLPYFDANPTVAQMNALVDAVNGGGAVSYSQWSGTLSADLALTSGNYRSALPSTAVEYTGDGAPDMLPSWTGNVFTVPEDGHYRITWAPKFDADSTGNRLAGLLKNWTSTTHNSSTMPGTGYWLRDTKWSSTTDTASGVAIWTGWLESSDQIMPLVRTTSACNLEAGLRKSLLTVELMRTTR